MDTIDIVTFKRHTSTIINRVALEQERIILTSSGKPQAALVSIADLQKLEALENAPAAPSRAQRKAALAMAQAVREMTLARRGTPFSGVTHALDNLREARDQTL